MHRARLINACLDTTTRRDDRTSRPYSQPSRGSSEKNLHNARQILITDCAEPYMFELLYVNSPSAQNPQMCGQSHDSVTKVTREPALLDLTGSIPTNDSVPLPAQGLAGKLRGSARSSDLLY
jgi:hypothetical protein